MVREGDCVLMAVPDPEPLGLKPEAIPLKIIYEDESLLVVDKPPGMVVHPAPGHSSGTLVNALLHHCSDLAGIGGVQRPGIVHRLDKETSGLMVVAKSDSALQALSRQFKLRSIKKQYLAIVRGEVHQNQGTIDAPIGRHKIHRKKMASSSKGRKASTGYSVLARLKGCSIVKLFPKTGRTHQIRVHLASIGYPILGDRLYGGSIAIKGYPELARHALHAYQLELAHPVSHKLLNFKAPLPKDMEGFFPESFKDLL